LATLAIALHNIPFCELFCVSINLDQTIFLLIASNQLANAADT